MKKEQIAIVGGLVLVLVFAVASYLYTSQQAAEMEAVAARR